MTHPPGRHAWIPAVSAALRLLLVGAAVVILAASADSPQGAAVDAMPIDSRGDGGCPGPVVVPPPQGEHLVVKRVVGIGIPELRYIGDFELFEAVTSASTYQLDLELASDRCTVPATTVLWKLTGPVDDPGATTLVSPSSTCAATFTALRAGVYDVEVQRVDGLCSKTYRARAEVRPKVVVGLGDSFGAGEGLPPYAFPACHRGAAALQGEIVRAAYAAVPLAQRRPVVFLHTACSAANSEHLFESQTTPYGDDGQPAVPVLNPAKQIPAQLELVRRYMNLLGDGVGPSPRAREPDAVLITNGGNDLSFVGYLFTCGRQTVDAWTFWGRREVSICEAGTPYPAAEAESRRVAGVARQSLERTERNFATLARCFATLDGGSVWVGPGTLDGIDQHEVPVNCPLTVPISDDRVVLTSYVNGLRGPTGFCKAIGAPGFNLEPTQTSWLSTFVMTPLEQTIRNAAASQCWTHTSIYDADVASGRGVCAPEDQQWIFPIISSILAGAPQRSVHPNPRGTAAFAAAAAAQMAERIAGQTALETTITEACACVPPPPPAFVGSPTPQGGAEVDWTAMDAEQATYTRPNELMFTAKIPHNPDGQCGEIVFQLPSRCGAGFTDYTAWRMGGAAGILLFPISLPSFLNDWLHNPGYFAEGMMDPGYTHPAKDSIPGCQGGGGNYCAIGSYGSGTDDHSVVPSNLARQDTTPGPMQPGTNAYGGRIRAFPVYQRTTPDLSLPAGYQVCYDRIHLNAMGGGVTVGCQNADSLEHGSIYVTFQATCPMP